MSLVKVTGLEHFFGDKKVFSDTGMELYKGDKLGLTGLNGAGKSTLIKILSGIIIPDKGDVRWNPKITVGYLDQQAMINGELTVRRYLKGAFRRLYEHEQKLNEINSQVASCTDMEQMSKLLETAGEYQNELEMNNFYSIDSEIDKVAAGLGIAAFGLDTPVSKLSGGQRAKVMLANLLLQNPDVLLLDEPTNFLDRSHIEWLGKYLSGFKGSFVLVSHDFHFLNRVVNCICDIEFFKISRYNGTYESFVRQKEAKSDEYVRNYNRQQKEIAKLEDYISKNLVRASTTKMAQSRRKKLEKMDRIDKPSIPPKPTFEFVFKTVSRKSLLKVHKLAVGYEQPLLPAIDLLVRTGDKVAVTGFNGIGKSTFLKTLSGILRPLSGTYRYDPDTIIGYYEQENRWSDPGRTAFNEIKDHFAKLKDREIRAALVRCGLKPEQAMQSLESLSGGEQAKVKICKLVLRPCNLLILDEPTNHLDVNAIERLKEAVVSYEGAVIFVSHSKDFCSIADRTLDMEKLFD